jgi:hypothetical protein
MKTLKIEITETELDIIRQSLSVLKHSVIKDADGYIKRKMVNSEDKDKYIVAIDLVYQRFLNLGID